MTMRVKRRVPPLTEPEGANGRDVRLAFAIAFNEQKSD